MSEESKPQSIQVTISPTADYVFRDMIHISAKSDFVLLEFGNENTHPKSSVTIANRIVVSLKDALYLHQILGDTIQQLQQLTQPIDTKETE